jgi:hypothetical protein
MTVPRRRYDEKRPQRMAQRTSVVAEVRRNKDFRRVIVRTG